jgi:5-methylthioadenosine/S-adenosylhomocysteine deaminase
VIDGRLVMRDRKVLTVDENALLAEAEQVARRCAARAGIELPASQIMQVQSHA